MYKKRLVEKQNTSLFLFIKDTKTLINKNY